ncbi:hypothetical protein JOF53_002307 [Crossiella equi]|uniref:Uncharacterized protein n=1 Tax=Crossiella equi TaxID=130796 RepID=A0ABS5AA28_9PSEU|nr:hypothetical protein [Crossiella equi]
MATRPSAAQRKTSPARQLIRGSLSLLGIRLPGEGMLLF